MDQMHRSDINISVCLCGCFKCLFLYCTKNISYIGRMKKKNQSSHLKHESSTSHTPTSSTPPVLTLYISLCFPSPVPEDVQAELVCSSGAVPLLAG